MGPCPTVGYINIPFLNLSGLKDWLGSFFPNPSKTSMWSYCTWLVHMTHCVSIRTPSVIFTLEQRGMSPPIMLRYCSNVKLWKKLLNTPNFCTYLIADRNNSSPNDTSLWISFWTVLTTANSQNMVLYRCKEEWIISLCMTMEWSPGRTVK